MMSKVGRKRKPLIEKSTSLIIKLQNKTIFQLCDKFNIDIEKDAEIIDDSTKRQINAQIVKILENYIK